jgi:hypothetical protein
MKGVPGLDSGMNPRWARFSLSFLFLLILVAAVALSVACLPWVPSLQASRVFIILLLVLYFLKWSLQDHERQGARARAIVAALTVTPSMVYMAASLPPPSLPPGFPLARYIATPVFLVWCALFAFQAIVSVVIVVWQANDYPEGWRPRFLRKDEKPWLIVDDGPSRWLTWTIQNTQDKLR